MAGLLGSACAPAAPADPDYVAGRTIYRTCASCHGSGGEGGVGRPLDEVRLTFTSCEDQVEWIRLGSERWLNEVGDTYGTGTTRTIEGKMPPFEASLSELELRQAALYERVRFGGGDLATERSDCGV